MFDGFHYFNKLSSEIETENAELSFIAPNGKLPDVTVYYNPEYDDDNHVFVNYGTDVTSELYDPIDQVCKLPKVYNEDARPDYLVIAKSVTGRNLNFRYEDGPKFREQQTSHMYFDTLENASEEPFSKNVTIKTHAEYTSHINGKIGESTGVLNGILLRADAGLQTITGATWEEARDAYVAGKTVLLRQDGEPASYYNCNGYDPDIGRLKFGPIKWYSDGRIMDSSV